MQVTYDPNKNAINITERGLSFEQAKNLDFATAFTLEDTRRDYGETRYITYALLGERLHVLVYTETEVGIRVISLRKANKREVKNYEKFQ